MRDHTVQEFLAAGGRICHITDPQTFAPLTKKERRLFDKTGQLPVPVPARTVTIAYFRDLASTSIHYGASIFNPDWIREAFDRHTRKLNNQQAVDRACNFPVTIQDPIVLDPYVVEQLNDVVDLDLYPGLLVEIRHEYLRKMVRKHGVQDLSEAGGLDLLQIMLEAKRLRE